MDAGRTGIIMPMTQTVVRGNLAVNPKFFPARTTDDGVQLQARLVATVYTNHPRYNKDGSLMRNEAGRVVYRDEPEKTKINFFGRDAEILADLDLRQGDPVVVTGSLGEPEAFISERDGQAYARNVVKGSTMQIDAIRDAQRRAAQDARRMTDTAGMDRTDQATMGADPTAMPGEDPWAASQTGPVMR